MTKAASSRTQPSKPRKPASRGIAVSSKQRPSRTAASSLTTTKPFELKKPALRGVAASSKQGPSKTAASKKPASRGVAASSKQGPSKTAASTVSKKVHSKKARTLTVPLKSAKKEEEDDDDDDDDDDYDYDDNYENYDDDNYDDDDERSLDYSWDSDLNSEENRQEYHNQYCAKFGEAPCSVDDCEYGSLCGMQGVCTSDPRLNL